MCDMSRVLVKVVVVKVIVVLSVLPVVTAMHTSKAEDKMKKVLDILRRCLALGGLVLFVCTLISRGIRLANFVETVYIVKK